MIRAFEVSLNGNRVCTAGIEGGGVVALTVNYVSGGYGDELFFNIGGLVTAAQEHLLWDGGKLNVGDELHVKVVDTVAVDEPTTRYSADSEKDIEQQKAYARDMIKKLGWTVNETAGSE